MTSSLYPLAIQQTFSNLDLKTNAWTKLNQAATAFRNDELTKSANLFLESWRILQNEYEGNLYLLDYSLRKAEQYQQRQHTASENKGRMLLSLVALHDLAKVCFRNHEKYKDKDGKCKLEVYASRSGWLGNTTTEALEIEENNEIKSWPEGSAIAHVLLLKDPLGRLLEKADSFNEAAVIIASICSLQFDCVSDPLKKHLDGCKFLSDSLLRMRLRIPYVVAAIKAASGESSGFEQMQEDKKDNIEDEDEKTRKKLIVKMNELERKKNPINKEEEEELIELFKRCHVTPSLWKGRS
jgi:hypothetical protein